MFKVNNKDIIQPNHWNEAKQYSLHFLQAMTYTNVMSTDKEDSKLYMSPAGIYLLKVINRITRTRCEICSNLTIKIPEQRHWFRFGVFIVNFEHISHIVLVFLLPTLSR